VTVVGTRAPNVHYRLAVPALVVLGDAGHFARGILAFNSFEDLAMFFTWLFLLSC
jgi:hypothetical protein